MLWMFWDTIIFLLLGLLNGVQLGVIYYFYRSKQNKKTRFWFFTQFFVHSSMVFVLYSLIIIFSPIYPHSIILQIIFFVIYQVEITFIFFKLLKAVRKRIYFFIFSLLFFSSIRFFYEVKVLALDFAFLYLFQNPELNILWLAFFFHVVFFFVAVFILGILLTTIIIYSFYANQPNPLKKIAFFYSISFFSIPTIALVDLLVHSLGFSFYVRFDLWIIFQSSQFFSNKAYFTIGHIFLAIFLLVLTTIIFFRITPSNGTKRTIVKKLPILALIFIVFAIYFTFILNLLKLDHEVQRALDSAMQYILPLPNKPSSLGFYPSLYPLMNISVMLFLSPFVFLYKGVIQIIHNKRKVTQSNEFSLQHPPMLIFSLGILTLIMLVVPIFTLNEFILYFLYFLIIIVPSILFQIYFNIRENKKPKEYLDYGWMGIGIIFISVSIFGLIISENPPELIRILFLFAGLLSFTSYLYFVTKRSKTSDSLTLSNHNQVEHAVWCIFWGFLTLNFFWMISYHHLLCSLIIIFLGILIRFTKKQYLQLIPFSMVLIMIFYTSSFPLTFGDVLFAFRLHVISLPLFIVLSLGIFSLCLLGVLIMRRKNRN